MLAVAQNGFVDILSKNSVKNQVAYFMEVKIQESTQSEKSIMTPIERSFALQNRSSGSPEVKLKMSRQDRSSIKQRSSQSSDIGSQFDRYTMKLSQALKQSVRSKDINTKRKDP